MKNTMGNNQLSKDLTLTIRLKDKPFPYDTLLMKMDLDQKVIILTHLNLLHMVISSKN